MNELISFGGGVNSVALVILLVREDWRGPIVFADTGCEWPDTYCYMQMFEAVWLKPRGMEIVRLGGEYRAQGHGRDRRSLVDYCTDYACTPFAGTRWCTQGWKTDVINHWAAVAGIETQIIGIAADEAHRQKGRNCPLIERGIDRAGCANIIMAESLPVPHKSGCYICPFQRVGQWQELWQRYPDLYARAEDLERLASARRGKKTVLLADGVHTLADMRHKFEAQLPLFDTADYESYRPCICTL